MGANARSSPNRPSGRPPHHCLSSRAGFQLLQGSEAWSLFYRSARESRREGRHERSAQRFSGRLRSRTTRGNSPPRRRQAHQSRLGHSFRSPLHAKRKSYERPDQARPRLRKNASNGTFKIPPGDPDYKVDASFEVQKDVKLVALHPHMHSRGKSFEYRLTFPDGRTETILSVPAFNWHWQLWYNLTDPISLPRGTKIECTAHFDNSPGNPENPDPTKAVIWGQQSWDEMMVGFFNLKFDANMSAAEVRSPGSVHTH